MVYVVERYLPGLHRSDLLSGLSRLEPMREGAGCGAEVRYLGSTIVLRDEACFCQFEGPLLGCCGRGEPAGRPPVRPDRPRSDRQSERSRDEHLSVHPRDRRDQARSLHRPGCGRRTAGGSRHLARCRVRVRQRQLDHHVERTDASSTTASSAAHRTPQAVPSIMSLTPARLAAGALGTGYALPSTSSGPTMESVLASMSPADPPLHQEDHEPDVRPARGRPLDAGRRGAARDRRARRGAEPPLPLLAGERPPACRR